MEPVGPQQPLAEALAYAGAWSSAGLLRVVRQGKIPEHVAGLRWGMAHDVGDITDDSRYLGHFVGLLGLAPGIPLDL
eukprot:13659122-Alexandrium_andersonii.AAC.1